MVAVTMLLPILGACCVAMLVPTIMRNAPIYDSLREHTLRSERARQDKIGKNKHFQPKIKTIRIIISGYPRQRWHGGRRPLLKDGQLRGQVRWQTIRLSLYQTPNVRFQG